MAFGIVCFAYDIEELGLTLPCCNATNANFRFFNALSTR